MSQQSMTMNYQFNALNYEPHQGGEAHPIGKYAADIVNTEIKPNKDNSGGYFQITFKTSVGEIRNNYNLWNNNEKAADIAHKQLSALCHAIGIYNVDMNNGGAALRGGKCQIDVGKQKDSEYVEVKRVYDAAGNEPGKAAAPQAAAPASNGFGQPQPQPQPQTGGFASQPQPQADQQQLQPQPQQNAGGWPANGQATQAAPQPQPVNNTGFNQQPSQPSAPAPQAPWGQR